MREPEEEKDVTGTESKSKATFLKISKQMPIVQMTPPTPTTATVADIDGIEPKRRKNETSKSFPRLFRKSSSKG